MDEFHRPRIKELESDSRHSEDMHLSPEFMEISATLVEYDDLSEELR